MSGFLPSAQQERWLLLSTRMPEYRSTTIVAAGIGDWRSAGFITRCALFVLGLIVVAMTSAICGVMFNEHFALPAGCILLGAGELLVNGKRLHAAGIEEALIISGLILIAIGLLNAISGFKDQQAAFVVALACLATGIRLLNALFTTLAAMVLSFAISFAFDFALFNTSSANSTHAIELASLYCFVLAVVALVLGARRYERPSHDRMLDWLVLVMPVVGYLWSAVNHSFNTPDYRHPHTLFDLYTPLAPLLLGIAALIVGLKRRIHAPLISFMLCMACVAYELRNLTGMPLQARLIVWGSLILIAASIIDRLLRTPRNGITSLKLNEATSWDLAELAGAALIAPAHHTQPTQQNYEGSGGSFGGGGASGKF